MNLDPFLACVEFSLLKSPCLRNQPTKSPVIKSGLFLHDLLSDFTRKTATAGSKHAGYCIGVVNYRIKEGGGDR